MRINIFFNQKNFFIVFLCLFSLLFNFYYGYRGVFPIDSFLIFDAAFNITSGNHPFKDYWLITGPLLDYIQSLFFLIFGINWFSYVLHASLLNMMLALFSFYFFLNIGLKTFYAFIYSLAVAVLAYPSIGTPFIDHHAAIFGIMALYSLSLGILIKKNLFWFFTPMFLVFSFFSKQIPSSYLLILFVIVISYYFFITKALNKQNFLYLFFGSLFSILSIIIIFFINEIPVKNFLVQYIFYPFSLGEGRIDKLNIDFKNSISQFKFIYFSLIPLLISLLFLIKINEKSLIQKKEIIVSFLFLGSIIIFIYCQLLTKNQVLIFFLIPISIAFSHSYANKYFDKKYLIYFILVIFIFSTVKYHIRFNHNKKFMELTNADFNLAVDAGQLDNIFAGLNWITPHYIDEPLNEINLLIDTKNILSKVKEKKIIITDYQFFGALLKNKIVSPNRFYDGQGIPGKKNKYYKAHYDFFLDKIKINKVKYLYFIGGNKHKHLFFVDFIEKNKCMALNQINELLIELNIGDCKF